MSVEKEDSKEQNRDNLLRSKNIQTSSQNFSVKQLLKLSNENGSDLDARSSVIVVPSLQRRFEWWLNKIEQLFDSLMKGLPIGRILLWKISDKDREQMNFNHFITKFNGRDRVGSKADNIQYVDDIYAVLDGQQRITALRIGLDGSYMVHIKNKSWKKDENFIEHSLCLDLFEGSYVKSDYENFLFWSHCHRTIVLDPPSVVLNYSI